MYFILNMQNECEIFWKMRLNFHGFEFSDSRFSRNFMRRNQYGIKNQKLFHKNFDHTFTLRYGSTGCGVFKQGVQN